MEFVTQSIGKVLPENFTGPCQTVNGQGAGTCIGSSDQKKKAVKFHRFPDHCPACFAQLHHEDLIGKYKGTCFHVKGFICPACRYSVGKIHHKNFRDSIVRFDWRRLELPRNAGKYSGLIGGAVND